VAARVPHGFGGAERFPGWWNLTPRWAWAITALLGLLGLAGALRLEIDVEVLNLLPTDSDAAQGVRLYQRNFLNARELVVAVEGPDADSTGLAVEAIAARLSALTNRVARVFAAAPWTETPESSAEFLAYLWRNAPPERVAALAQSLAAGRVSATLEAAREKIATSLNPEDLFLAPYDPLGLSGIGAQGQAGLGGADNAFGSSDGTFRIVYVYASEPLTGYEECHAWLAAIRPAVRDAVEAAGLTGVRTHLTGRPVFVDEIATGMKTDMRTAVPGTLAMIGLLFYLAHREVRSLLLLVAALAATTLLAGAWGGLIFGTLNVLSLGFAAILVGLAEDFGIVLHQEARLHPQASASEIRRLAGPGILWSALTTGVAFLLLNVSSLPGLRQLGTLVGLGIFAGAWVMLFLFLPLLPRRHLRPVARRRTSRPMNWWNVPRITTVALAVGGVAVLCWRRPEVIASPEVLRPRHSEASRTLKLLQQRMEMPVEPVWLLARGASAAEAGQLLADAQPRLEQAQAEGVIRGYTLPTPIWPNPEHQQENGPVLESLAGRRMELIGRILESGFTTNATRLTDRVLRAWDGAGNAPAWPEGRVAEWLVPRVAAEGPDGWLGLGLLYPGPNFAPERVRAEGWPDALTVAGWPLLGQSMFQRVMRELPPICGGVAAVVLVSLYLTFRQGRDVAVSLAVLGFSGLVLSAAMALLGWNWNLISLMALPLLLGMGVDYSIHMQLALRRAEGDAEAARAGVGRALLLAGSTTIIGFGLLGTSSNLGLASLGAVCALGLAIALFTAVALLPGWQHVRH